jgi:SAM-dependent methyltransferase
LYRYERPVSAGATTASTPEAWAKNFAASKKSSRWGEMRLAAGLEMQLIERYLRKGATILDAGCGFGEWAALLAKRGYRTIGVDYSSELIGRLREAHPDCEWTQADIRALPNAEASVDGVISWGVIEHDEAGPEAALREFRRILRPNGIAIVTVPIDSHAARRAGEILDRQPGREHAFFQYLMSPEELRAEAANAGFEVLESGTLPVAHLALVAPRLMQRLRGPAFRIANLAVHYLMSWIERYRVMHYVVLRKPS